MGQQHSVYFDDELLDHILTGRNEEAMSMLNENLVKSHDDWGTLLHHAAYCGNELMARNLIELGAEIDSRGKGGKTPLMMAILQYHAAVVKVLLEANANIDIVSAEGHSALQMCFAIDYTDESSADIIVAIIRRVQMETDSMEQLVDKLINAGCTLVQTVYTRDFRLLNCMMERGIDVDSRSSSQKTALQVAAILNDLDLAKWLVIEKGADVNAFDGDGDQALFEAAWNGNASMVEFLLERGADPLGANSLNEEFLPLSAVLYTDNVDDEQLDECTMILLHHGGIPESGELSYPKEFDFPSNCPLQNRMRMVIAHLAMLRKRGKSVDKMLENMNKEVGHEMFARVAEYYNFCQKTLAIPMFRSWSLFDLLTINKHNMGMCARNENFVAKIEENCAKHQLNRFYSYYYRVLIKRVSEARRIAELEDEAIAVISDIFQRNLNKCYIAARKIVEYLNESDLEQLGQVIHDC